MTEKKKIGQVLLENKLITQEILDEALRHQAKSGGNITQYLLSAGYINNEQLTRCLCCQFGVPYLPLRCYDISEDVISLVPVDISQRYGLVPVERLQGILSVVMVNPLDSIAIKEVEAVTGCKVYAFVGLLSEVTEVLKSRYKIDADGKILEVSRKLAPIGQTEIYQGNERRAEMRFSCRITINLTQREQYLISKTKNISRSGLCFNLGENIFIGSQIGLKFRLPKEIHIIPIDATAQVVRVNPLRIKKFEVGAKIIEISNDELNILMRYAATHKTH